MFERFTAPSQEIVAHAQEHARRLGHRFIGGEHLLLTVAGSPAPVGGVLRAHGITLERVESQVVDMVGLGAGAGLFAGLDAAALATIGIDLDAVRARVEAVYGPDALARAGSDRGCRRRARVRTGRVGGATSASGYLPFTPRAKKTFEDALHIAAANHDTHVGPEHIALALLDQTSGPVPPILAALDVTPTALRAAITDRYRAAG